MMRVVFVAVMVLILTAQIVGCSSIQNLVQGNELTTITDKLELGMDKAEVKKLFGRTYTSVDGAIDGSEVWRFDTATDEGYMVSPEAGMETGTESGIYYDRNGFLTGKLSSQVFIFWTENNQVKDAIIYYSLDGEIHEYRLST